MHSIYQDGHCFGRVEYQRKSVERESVDRDIRVYILPSVNVNV